MSPGRPLISLGSWALCIFEDTVDSQQTLRPLAASQLPDALGFRSVLGLACECASFIPDEGLPSAPVNIQSSPVEVCSSTFLGSTCELFKSVPLHLELSVVLPRTSR